MGRARAPKHKLSRRFGMDIYGTGGAQLQRRMNIAPGARPGGRRRKVSEYGLQLLEKQKVKAIYGVQERQFRRYYAEAVRLPGVTGRNLLQLLERRLDNVVYRIGFARSRPMARQMVSHRHVLVNGKKVNIPSYLVRPGEAISLTETGAQMPTVVEEIASNRLLPRWIERDDGTARVTQLPSREDVDLPINEEMIVEFYSR
jgi:small subunit ribosomal protein S4